MNQSIINVVFFINMFFRVEGMTVESKKLSFKGVCTSNDLKQNKIKLCTLKFTFYQIIGFGFNQTVVALR